VRHALGDVPLVGFFAAGEIAHQNLYGYTGVLTVFRHAPERRRLSASARSLRPGQSRLTPHRPAGVAQPRYMHG